MSSPRDNFGGAPIGGGQKYETFSCSNEKPTTVPLRIFPAMGALAADGKWAIYHKIHFGYSGRDFKDKTKTKQRPFECIEVVDPATKMVTTSCPECRLIESHEKILADKTAIETAKLKSRGVLDEKVIENELKVLLKTENEWLKAHNISGKHYIGVVDQTSKLGVLQIAHKHMKVLYRRMDELRSKGLEPIADFDTGVWFIFSRSGTWNQTEFEVTVAAEQNGLTSTIKLAPLSDDILTKALAQLPNLQEGVTKHLTATQIKLLVECSGDPDEVDTILEMGQKNRQQQPVSNNLPAPTQPAATAPAADPQAALQAQLAALQAQLAALSKPAATPAPTGGPPTVPGSNPKMPDGVDPMDPNLSPEQFAQMFGRTMPKR